MKKVIFDCDNTMGLKNCDVNDGLALLYLLGEKNIDVIGVTLTHGNNDIETVYKSTWDLFDKFDIRVPLIKGCEKGEDRITEAAIFMAENAARFPNEITIIGTGSMSNIYGAAQFDEDFFENVKDIIIMGGMTQPINLNGAIVKELNFSCDYEAAYSVLFSKANVTVLNANVASCSLFTNEELKECYNSKVHTLKEICEMVSPWQKISQENFKIDGFYNWEIATAAIVAHPELFNSEEIRLVSGLEDLKQGILKISSDAKGKAINMPSKIIDTTKLNTIILDSLKNFAKNS